MDDSLQQQVLEGTWEEVSRHSDALAGRRVRVVVLEETPEQPAPRPSTSPAPTDEEARAYQAKVRAFLDGLKEIEPEPPRRPPTEFEEILIEKFRKQGLRL